MFDRKYIEAGQIIKRPGDFYRMKNVFHTTVPSVKKILDKMDLELLRREKITVDPQLDRQRIVFGVGVLDNAVAALTTVGGKDERGRYLYDFRLHSWRDTSGFSGDLKLNLVLTSIEKAILVLDYDADVQRSFVSHKVKTSFI